MTSSDKPLREISASDVLEFSRERGDPEWVSRLRLKALEYLKSTPPDPLVDPCLEGLAYRIVLEGYLRPGMDLEEALKALKLVGADCSTVPHCFAGLAVNVDNRVLESVLYALQLHGLKFEPMDEAVRRYPALKDYAFRALDPTSGRKAAYHVLLWSGGSFVYVPRGLRVPLPLHTLFVIASKGLVQTEHTLIILEEGAELTWVEGAATHVHPGVAAHLGGLEAFVGRRAVLRVVGVVNWPSGVHHMPSERVVVDEEGYAELTRLVLGAETVNSDPLVELRGRGSRAALQNVALYRGRQRAYNRPKLVYAAPEARGQILNRSVITEEAFEEFGGRLEVRRGARGAVGYMSCNALLLGEHARSVAVPGLDSEERDCELSHEASVGRVSYDKIYYLMLMGFSEEEATWMIVSGFLEPALKSLPPALQEEARRIVRLALKGH